ncbi:nuclear distribution protein nudE-like 1 isoform X1 [Macrosteles quadrilineatus]|uniref:nuclear distribution protein nudE-like 1 isoform X1 n=1 Tax=Macrosteles quadrilineatus TaxID=74068 RepID=UPI0023E12E6D|nr:nuclear distribution protein nudE-like 1 isoform X1 [Macrosteles quadrilineatus]XP_054289702.1 nuclear distribution protein nudE-like 1 isoform X1 [Macrosteles quadrilineatus]
MATFSEKDEDANWKRKYEEAERDLQDFQESSRLIEKELEMSLDQAEQQIRELRSKCNRLQFENETLRDKVESSQKEKMAQIQELQEELSQSQQREEHYRKYIRELEQKNDDLERAQRAMYVSLGDFETKLNASIERNVLLESELDEKESLKVMVQRLKDEARDLKQEIQVIQRTKATPRGTPVDSNKLPDSLMQTPTHNTSVKSANMPARLTPLRGATTMDIVGDLLKKVGALEAKLASCRNLNGDAYSRPRRLNRSSTSSPTIHNLGRQ